MWHGISDLARHLKLDPVLASNAVLLLQVLRSLSDSKAQDEPAPDTLYSRHPHAFVQVVVAEVGLVLSQGATEKIHPCNVGGGEGLALTTGSQQLSERGGQL